MAEAECRKCGFVGCICHRGERDDAPPPTQQGRGSGRRDKGPGPKRPNRSADPKLEALKQMAARVQASEARTAVQEGRSVPLPRGRVFEFFEGKGFVRGEFEGELTFVRSHQRCKHVLVTVYTSLAAKEGSKAAIEDAVRVTAVFIKERRGGKSPFVKVLYESSRLDGSGDVEACLERAISRAREAYDAGNKFLKDDGCYDCTPRD